MKPAKGQRWLLTTSGSFGDTKCEQVIAEVVDGVVEFEGGGCDDIRDFTDAAAPNYRYTYLGSDTPSPPACGATSKAYPSRPCKLSAEGEHVHDNGDGYRWLTDARATPVTPPKPQVRECDRCGIPISSKTLCPPCDAALEKAYGSKPPVYGRMVGEMRDGDGTPLTALQRIQAQAKPKPTPTPYIPSVDEWDLLPDVDVRR